MKRCSPGKANHPFSRALLRAVSPEICAVLAILLPGIIAMPAFAETTLSQKTRIACRPDNDLYRVLVDGGAEPPRFEIPAEAVADAPDGGAVLILADGYPAETTNVAPEVFEEAARKGLRLYVEYPSALPGLEVAAPRRTELERAVVVSEAFGDDLPPMQLLAIHDCHFVETRAERCHLVVAKVAGFDRAVYGIDDVATHPLLFEHPRGDILVCTTKMSQFVTARYATADAVQAVWQLVFQWLAPDARPPRLEWTPTVRPSYRRDEPLPDDAQRRAVIRGIDWHTTARMLPHESWVGKHDEYREQGIVDAHNPVGPRPDPSWPTGDGEHGVLEGVNSRIRYDGEQPIRWWFRTDSNGESSVAFALRARLDGDERSARIARNLLDWVYFKSGFFHDDPDQANYGLIDWGPDNGAHYGDNDIKILLGAFGAAALLNESRWDERIVKNILGNFRTTGVYGFRPGSIGDADVLSRGWRHFWSGHSVNLAPHYQAWIWSAYLWLYDKTNDPLLLERTRRAIEIMMDAYPDDWRWTNGLQQERGRMLLALAWLIRVDDQPRHREWLHRIALDMQRSQVASGAIHEELGDLDKGGYRPPLSNAEYGQSEASLIQQNGDPVADLLYTCNFTFLGLHEAFAATAEPLYGEMADRLAEFLIRAQVRSEAHPELDGAWFRAFDTEKWDYWGSNADAGWGAWSVEVGWTQGWVSTVLALRELNLNLWDLSSRSEAGRHWPAVKNEMLADADIERIQPKEVKHAGVGAAVTLAQPPDPRYPARGAKSLTDGFLGPADCGGVEWLGFYGEDFTATIDLGKPIDITGLGASFLHLTRAGVFLPPRVEFLLSEDGANFQPLKTVPSSVRPQEEEALTSTVIADDLKARGRYVRVRAENVGTMPDWHEAAGKTAWLFVDEILVNP